MTENPFFRWEDFTNHAVEFSLPDDPDHYMNNKGILIGLNEEKDGLIIQGEDGSKIIIPLLQAHQCITLYFEAQL